MKHSERVAREGLLTALCVVLLWLSGTVPMIGWGGCVCAGIFPAMSFAKKQIKSGIIIYAASTILSALIVPSKRYVIGYLLVFGSYPMIKYAIEQLKNLTLEWVLKLIYALFAYGVFTVLINLGKIIISPRLGDIPTLGVAALFIIAFIAYDIIFSKMIALFCMITK